MDKGGPPVLFDLIFQLYAEWAVIPGIGQTSVNLGAGEDKASALTEGNDLIEGASWHIEAESSREVAISPLRR